MMLKERILSLFPYFRGAMYDVLLELLAVVILLRLAGQPPPCVELLPWWSVDALELDGLHDVLWLVSSKCLAWPMKKLFFL